MKSITLNGIWDLSGKPQEQPNAQPIFLKAEVPGCVQLDLSREGFLPEDLFKGTNIRETEKYEDWEWWYERTFTAPEERENVFLVFEGVDCLAEYFLNGVKIGESENMLIAHEFEVGKYLIDGENTLMVHITSPVIANHYRDMDIMIQKCNHNPAVETGTRRAPHTYGWDIMPRAVTSGLWRDVKLEVRDKVYFKQYYIRTCPNTNYLGVDYEIIFELACKWSDFKDLEIEIFGNCGEDSSFHERYTVMETKIHRFYLNIENPKLWWPYGYGDPNVYDVTMRIYKAGELIHEEFTSFGIRTVKLEKSDTTDGKDGQFRFLINDVEIMCKGTNWVPLDAFHSRDAERYEPALAMVKDLGCNIIRCWGGNVYEDHAFFDFCDRNGIMVWQDFSMACRYYPQDPEYAELIRKEATAVVRKLRNHPSIILWCGANEIDNLYHANRIPITANKLTFNVIPDVITYNDFGRPYITSSPFISMKVYESGRLDNWPEHHPWGARDYFKNDTFARAKSHFISEMGYLGTPSVKSLRKFIESESLYPDPTKEEWILHSSDQRMNPARIKNYALQLGQFFSEVPTDIENFVLASQITQAEAKKYFIEHIRVNRPNKTGIIWWNLLDGWPQLSDAIVDYYFDKKLAYEYIKRAQQPFALCADDLWHWSVNLYACNDTLVEKRGKYTIIDAQTDEVIGQGNYIAAANGSTKIHAIPVGYTEHKMLIFKWENEDGTTGFNHFLCGYPPFELNEYKALMEKWGL